MKPRYDHALDFTDTPRGTDGQKHLDSRTTCHDSYICYAGHIHDLDELAEVLDILEMNGIPPIAWSK